jgi:hypothetical protein
MVAKRCCCPSCALSATPNYLARIAVGAAIDADDIAFNHGALLIHRKELKAGGITDWAQIGKLPHEIGAAMRDYWW